MAFEAQLHHGEPLMVDYTPSGADVAAGKVVVTNDLVRIAHKDIVDGVLGALAVGGGVYKVTADGAIGAGKRVYWDDTNNKVTLTALANKAFGWTVTAASADGDTIYVTHDPSGALGGAAAANVAFTAGTNLAGVDGTGSNAAPLAGTETRLDALDTAVAAILTSLKNAGIMLSS